MKRSRARSHEAIEFARAERALANEFINTVWQWVRNRQICSQKFRREYPIPPYTADFCCPRLKFILEVDGADHFSQAGQDRDRLRDNFLNGQGYRVVRIRGYEVLCDGNWVREMIVEEVKRRMRELEAQAKPLTPGPSPRSGAWGGR